MKPVHFCVDQTLVSFRYKTNSKVIETLIKILPLVFIGHLSSESYVYFYLTVFIDKEKVLEFFQFFLLIQFFLTLLVPSVVNTSLYFKIHDKIGEF